MAEAAVVEGVSKHFDAGRRVEALIAVDLVVKEAELVVLLGRSGAGKSTLLTLIGGLDRPDAGTIHVGGLKVDALRGGDLDRFRQRTVGWAFQTAGLLPLLTALENVWLPLALLGQADGIAIGEARAVLRAVGLEDRADHRAYELSGGEQHRVALARALVKAPLLLLADEPTAQLDSESAREIAMLIRRAADSGTAVLFATHDRAVAEFADRVLVIEDGRVRESG
ncbi:MAG: ABC transporter ATP-binding protein [Chloroflexi bacterium]|nr:MAG: ABC transporter ATP-binding protein [Chloroflexota bacterium]